ncbi:MULTISPECIES: flagellar protein FlgN [unclassified Photobacterium]|uniref:flagellar protein FlgN n=1 Tax=unclassified Photobacterium TaxID=2628852 RepID=UPI001EDEC8D5|nr:MULTISPECIES: flagellar protein FlgN [unclassified Photobacterium]MCG3863982.1 flagellar protein FlgN [Photobacterium sp. Ph6]MCG3875490.1 flagellar protein FlgN [Photobacterium sp. Ph5]
MPNKPNKQQMIAVLIKDIQCDIVDYRQLYQLMQQQHQCYLKFDGELLSRLTEQQLPLLKQLTQRSQLRTKQLHKLGLPINNQSMNKLIHALPNAIQSKLQQQWHTLETLVKQCHKLNQRNGVLSANFSELLNQVYAQMPQQNDNNAYSTPHLMQY